MFCLGLGITEHHAMCTRNKKIILLITKRKITLHYSLLQSAEQNIIATKNE